MRVPSRIDEGLKWCPRCKEYKYLSEFYTIRESLCIECKKAQRKLDYASLTPEQKKARIEKRQNDPYREGSKRRNEKYRLSFTASEFKELRRRAALKHRYKVTPEWYNETLQKQRNGCALCGATTSKKLSVDHDHKCCPGRNSCGKCIRGIICQRCNAMLGFIESHPQWLEKLREYLKSPV